MQAIMYLSDNELSECLYDLAQDVARVPNAEDRELIRVAASRITDLHDELLDQAERLA